MRWLTVTLVLFAAVVVAASFMPNRGLWGVDHLALYPVPVRVLAIGLIVLSFIPPIARRRYSAAARALAVARSQRHTAAWRVAIALAALMAFWAFRSSTNLLGDGRIIEETLNKAFPRAVGGETMSADAFTRQVAPRSSGTALLYYFSANVGERLAGASPVASIQFVACALGAVFVFVALSVVSGNSSAAAPGLWLPILFLTSGVMQLFFGYVEFYAPAVVLGGLYLLAAYRLLHGRGRTWVPALFVILAIVCHVQALILLPSLVSLLVWSRARERRDPAMRRTTLAIVGVFAIGALALVFLTPLRSHVLPLFSTRTAHGLLSVAHARDVANALLLLLPALPVLAVMALVSRRRPAPDPSPASGAEESFALLLLIPSVTYLAAVNPVIGAARDWDLYAITLVGLLPSCLRVLKRFGATDAGLSWVRDHTLPVLVTSSVLAIAWIGINADSTRATHRFVRTLEFDPTDAGYAYETLAKQYLIEGRGAEALEAMSSAADISGNPRQVLNLAVMYQRSGDLDGAVAVLARFVRTHPDQSSVRHALITYLYGAQRLDETVTASRQAIASDPTDPFYPYCLGKALLQLGRTREAADALRECKRLGPSAATAGDVDAMLRRIEAGE